MRVKWALERQSRVNMRVKWAQLYKQPKLVSYKLAFRLGWMYNRLAFYKTDGPDLRKIRAFYKTDGPDLRKIRAFYKTDGPDLRKIRVKWALERRTCVNSV